MNEKVKQKYERMTAERCMDWCLLAYATSKAQGYFIAYQWRNEVRCAEILLVAARRVGLVEPTKPKGSIWVGSKRSGGMPGLTEAKILFDQYNRDQDAGKAKAKAEAEAKKKAEAKAQAKVEKLAPAPNKHSDKAAQPTQLDRIESKLNILLKEWKLS